MIGVEDLSDVQDDDLLIDVLVGADSAGLTDLAGCADPLIAMLAAWALESR